MINPLFLSGHIDATICPGYNYPVGTQHLPFLSRPATAFIGLDQVASGSLVDVALAVKSLEEQWTQSPLLVFDDSSGETIELDLRGTTADIVSRLTDRARRQTSRPARKTSPSRSMQGPGRPRLGVVAREVTLLPRHWEWLAAQPGGASAALRRLVEEARLADDGKTSRRQSTEAAYRFLSTITGNLPGFEEATRALFADDWKKLSQQTAKWPKSIRLYAQRLANPTPKEA